MTGRTLVINLDLAQYLLDDIQAVVPNWKVVASKDSESIENELTQAEVVLHWKSAAASALLEKNDQLKWIQTWSAGVNSLPLQELQQKRIILTSANGVHAYPISETIFALLLGLTRKIHTYVRQQQEKKWHHGGLELEIHGKTIGILGVGAIGQETAKIAKAFGMKVLGVRHSGKPDTYVDEMYTPNQLDNVLRQSDYIVITLPLTEETTHMFDSEQFRQMKDTAFLINIGRGQIINEDAFIKALKNKEIAGAGLDVFETEPLPEDSPLWEMDNVIVTPHTAGATEHYTERVVRDIFIPNLKHYLTHQVPHLNRVDYDKGY
ncbi:D-2-hydroxyacid dehydrogenase [Gracilibacillus alcaliphilus]|uniref:D-2-hydroxyacid dehydrogenase n=1 Tax=Gracilibacillus alcaliphilus TaxID=1401441 RepID=UPI00195A9224|nr:D-2-hydroxyacid dehydrogenase [Gracilibacillus alcaliphilus]MBM7677822.1 phosphoglycerate dehydrogenase-like enzyme [Gracilibacillus alcaliphilus]